MVINRKSPLFLGLIALAAVGVFLFSQAVNAKEPIDDYENPPAPGMPTSSNENLPPDVESTNPNLLCIDQNSVKDCEFYVSVYDSNNYQAYYARAQTWLEGGVAFGEDSTLKIDMCLDSDTNGWNSSPALCQTVYNGPTSSYSIYQDNQISIADENSNYTDYNYVWAHIRVYKTGTTNELEVRGRRVHIDHINPSPEPAIVGQPFSVSWGTKWAAQAELYWDGPAGIGSGAQGVNPNGSMNFTASAPGTVYFTIQATGPGGVANSSVQVQAHQEIQVIPAGLSGDIWSDFANCTKSGSNDCNIVLNYWTNGATSGAIYRNSQAWRDIPQGVVPNGTQVWNDPPVGSYTFALMGSNGGPLVQLDTVTVNIYPEGPPPTPGAPSCSPAIVTRLANQQASFTANGGVGPYTWTVTPQNGATASPASGNGSNFYTSVSAPGTHEVKVTGSNGLSNNCYLQIDVPPNPVVCSPASGTVPVYTSQTFTASGGPSNSYTWSVTPAADAGPPTGNGSSFTTMFNNVGPKSVTVTSGSETSTCNVQVIASTCSTLSYPSNAMTLPMGTTDVTFSFNSAPGRTNYILDLTTDPGFSWWWNNGTGSGGPGSVYPSTPITFNISVPLNQINNNFYASGRVPPAELLNGQTYYWRVYAYNQNDMSQPGCHTPINSFSVDTVVPTFKITYAAQPLNAPVLTVSNDICREINLRWTYDNNGVGQGFRVYRSESGTLGSFVQLPTSGPVNVSINARTFRDNDPTLQIGKVYYYRVDSYTNVSPARTSSSAIGSSAVVDCTADFSPSTFRISQYARQGSSTFNTYNSNSIIRDGDTLQFQITLTNIGPATASIRNLTGVMGDVTSNFGTYRLNRGTGFQDRSLGVNGKNLNFNLTSGTKCVSPDNPTGCTSSVDPSCTTSGTPTCNNWLVTFRAVVNVDDDSSQQESITGEALLEFQDLTGVRYQRIPLPSHIFQTQNREAPEFREVAP